MDKNYPKIKILMSFGITLTKNEKKEKYEVFFSLVLKNKQDPIEFTDKENFTLKQSIEHPNIIGNEKYSLFI